MTRILHGNPHDSSHDSSHDRLFRACADRTRLRLLNLLREGEACVGDLVAIIDAPQPTISRHLAYLRRSGLVEVEREGNWCFYRLAEPSGAVHDRLLDCLSCCIEESPELREDARIMDRLRKGDGCCSRTAT
jgi:ArsR family transcriptional regulator